MRILDYFKTIFETRLIYGNNELPRFSLELLTICSISILIVTLKIQALPDVIIGVVVVWPLHLEYYLPQQE